MSIEWVIAGCDVAFLAFFAMSMEMNRAEIAEVKKNLLNDIRILIREINVLLKLNAEREKEIATNRQAIEKIIAENNKLAMKLHELESRLAKKKERRS